MRGIEKLFKSLEKAKAKNTKEIKAIDAKIYSALRVKFSDWKALSDAIRRLETSDQYQWSSGGEIERRSRFSDLSDVPAIEREYLEQYLSEDHCAYIDWENDCLVAFEGPSIVINDAGDILDQDSGKWIIKKSNYCDDEGEPDEDKRNELIGQYMEKSGYFPGVFSVDRHGNVFLVNTQKGKDK